MSLSLKTIPLGIAYALLSAVGIFIITIIGGFVYKQTPNLPAIIGIAFIVCGIAIINFFLK